MKKKIRILLADDHRMVRRGLRFILESQDDMEVVAEADNGREAVEQTIALRPDVVIMDVTMPELGGIEATRRIRESAAGTRILALSVHRDGVYVREIVRAGAAGYILKESADTELLAATRAIAEGNSYLSPEVAGAVLQDYRKRATDPIDLLSPREREILQLIAEGMTNKEIATHLKLSIYTVDGHRTRIMEKLGLHNIGMLVRFAIKHGLVD
ncbi:MAG TPA: response regulator transcription factor [Bryobacteraceae bacterium]|jgi:two-component system response regulator NreC|nr:response regulator transcription factor [Bryobacteraceae bacterium]